MERGALVTLLFSAAFCSLLIAEQPILQPNSYGSSFEGPALGLECVAALKSDPGGFLDTVRAKSPGARRACVGQLLESLTPEPEFTAKDFQEAIQRDPHGNLAPENPELNRRMGNRLGVNLASSKAIAELASGRLIDDPSAIHPLIECLNHPLLEVSRVCEEALVSLTRQRYGWDFYYSYPRVPPTVEGRRRFIADWTEWDDQLKKGHPIFDEWLESQCLAALRAIGTRLIDVLRDSVAHGYIDYQVVRKSSIRSASGVDAEKLFEFDVGRGDAANWPSGASVNRVAILLSRPGIPQPRSINREDAIGNNGYREDFPGLDLELRVEIDSPDQALRRACFLAVNDGLTGLRDANGLAAPRR